MGLTKIVTEWLFGHDPKTEPTIRPFKTVSVQGAIEVTAGLLTFFDTVDVVAQAANQKPKPGYPFVRYANEESGPYRGYISGIASKIVQELSSEELEEFRRASDRVFARNRVTFLYE